MTRLKVTQLKTIGIIGPKDYKPEMLEFGRKLIVQSIKHGWQFIVTDEPNSFDSAFMSSAKILKAPVVALCADGAPRSPQSKSNHISIGIPPLMDESGLYSTLRRGVCKNSDVVYVITKKGASLYGRNQLMPFFTYAQSLEKMAHLIQL